MCVERDGAERGGDGDVRGQGPGGVGELSHRAVTGGKILSIEGHVQGTRR